ncbi:terminase large subunit domain-containing protein [Prescottella equi]|uniref:terminase large subunit domain-containing protein n=1 Tax=Rhodococcus hoagii TaxID=43767 RepID=UPI001F1BEF10|nr:terminase family protein [Prescottella equi]
MCAGRQVGKSRGVAIIALHRAFTQPGSLILLVSAGETASLRLLEECAALALNSPMLAGSVMDDHKTQLLLSNGSRIISVPASQRQIRGWSVDLLIIDEAGFVDNEIWRAAEPSIIARPGSQVILLSSPWGNFEHFFRRLWKQGTDTPSADVTAFHWPSSVSPLISQDDLNKIQAREPAHYFNREYLAEWTDETGAYFTTDELDNAVADYELIPPEQTERPPLVVGGIDWGYSNDANAVVFLAAQGDVELNRSHVGDEQAVFYIPWLEAHHRMPYAAFIDRLDVIANHFHVFRYVSETNGPGEMPSQVLMDRMMRQSHSRGMTQVNKVVTDIRRKASGFGRLKVLLQQGRLVLPNHPALLRQLHSLEFEQTATGQFRIAVPESAGHDDLAMSLLQAASPIQVAWPAREAGFVSRGDILTTPGGTHIHRQPISHPDTMLFGASPKRV